MDGPISFTTVKTKAGSSHDDVELRVGRGQHLVDSYYFALSKPEQKPHECLKHLLEQWLAILETLKPDSGNHQVYLPYGIFDQCTAWLQVSLGPAVGSGNSQIVLQGGWNTLEGWRINLSDVVPQAKSMTESSFEPIDDLTATTTMIALREAIERDCKRF